jgi:RsiW-degrading membrane proteinase PrsW (M82 family)
VVLIILALLASFIPSLILFFWLMKSNPDLDHQKRCRSALLGGVLACLPVVLASFIFNVVEAFLLGNTVPPIVKDLFHNFIVLAFAEELVKYFITRRTINKHPGTISWIDVMSYAAIVGIGFSLLESVVYAFSTNIIQIIVRGVTAGHGVYGLLMGYYLGKAFKTGDKSNYVYALLFPTLLHGSYDFSLSESLAAVSDLTVFIPFIIIAITLVVGIVLIVRIVKARKNNDQNYLAPLLIG